MHGTGEVYANPLRCPQLMLIDAAGTRAVLERGEENTDVILPQVKIPTQLHNGLSNVLPAMFPFRTRLNCRWLAACWPPGKWKRSRLVCSV
jgi:hypothetical protein